jgi:hypothetical protein
MVTQPPHQSDPGYRAAAIRAVAMTKMSADAAPQCLAESLAVLQELQLLNSRDELRLARFLNPDRTDPEDPLLLNEADYLLRLIARAHSRITAVYKRPAAAMSCWTKRC